MARLRAWIASAPAVFSIAQFDEGGALGRHDASGWQIFLVLSGRVKISASAGHDLMLTAGEAVQWHPGESHESVAVTPATVLIVEGPGPFVHEAELPAERSPGDPEGSVASVDRVPAVHHKISTIDHPG
jgi:hypothetical protein